LTAEQAAAIARQKREAELARIQEERAGGSNLFKELERQKEEERRRRFSKFAGDEPVAASSDSSPARAPTKKIESPFADLERKAQEEKQQSRFTPPAESTPPPSAAPAGGAAKVKSNPFL